MFLANLTPINITFPVPLSPAAPEIALAPAVVRVLAGQPVWLPCVILAGRPLPARLWLKDGQSVRVVGAGWGLWGQWGLHGNGGFVVAHPCSELPVEDVGGAFGLGGRIIRVFVLPKDGILGMTQRQRDKVVFAPRSLPLSCLCPAQVAPSGRFSAQADGSLHVGQASRGDAGTYTCVATNALGSHRQDVALVVHGERPGVPAWWPGWVLSPGLCCQLCATSAGRSCGFLAQGRLFHWSGREAPVCQGRKTPKPDLHIRNGPQGCAVRLQSRLGKHLVALRVLASQDT